jgi:hypothetical protein
MFQSHLRPDGACSSSSSLHSVNRLIAEATAILESSRGDCPEGARSEQRYLSTLAMAFRSGVTVREPQSAMSEVTTAFGNLRKLALRIAPQSFVALETVVHADAIECNRFLVEISKKDRSQSTPPSNHDLSGKLSRAGGEEVLIAPDTLLKIARDWQKMEHLMIGEFSSAIRDCRERPGSRELEMDLSLASRVSVT